ncbi:MAG: hypothetical protein OEW87_14000 [Flavobacteriaceae bacterium]|nr:hypothetical protein [Flavobacteriaceae bacterium]
MNYIIALVIVIFLCLSCSDVSQKNEKRVSIPSTVPQVDEIKDIAEIALSQNLYQELNNFVAIYDSLNFQDSVIAISFYEEEKGDCILLFASQPFYDRRHCDGYFLLNNKMIAFYEISSTCNVGLVKEEELKTEEIFDFPNENIRHTFDSYDPWGRKYRVHSNDSIELVFSGYF